MDRGSWRDRPARERLRREAGPNLLPEERELFPKIEARREFSDGHLTRAHLLGRCRGAQPGGERVLAGAGARRAEELKKRATAEHIEVGGVEVIARQETFSRLALADPAGLEASDPSFVEGGGSLAAPACADGKIVEYDEEDEEERRREERQRGRRASDEHEPSPCRCPQKDKKAPMRKPALAAYKFESAARRRAARRCAYSTAGSGVADVCSGSRRRQTHGKTSNRDP